MAKIQEQSVVIKFSKLIKDGDEGQAVIDSDVVTSLEAVAQELAGQGIIVEVDSLIN
jgi:hypothetical protein